MCSGIVRAQVMAGDAIGATDLLSGSVGECLQADMGQPAEQLADEVVVSGCPYAARHCTCLIRA